MFYCRLSLYFCVCPSSFLFLSFSDCQYISRLCDCQYCFFFYHLFGLIDSLSLSFYHFKRICYKMFTFFNIFEEPRGCNLFKQRSYFYVRFCTSVDRICSELLICHLMCRMWQKFISVRLSYISFYYMSKK